MFIFLRVNLELKEAPRSNWMSSKMSHVSPTSEGQERQETQDLVMVALASGLLMMFKYDLSAFSILALSSDSD